MLQRHVAIIHGTAGGWQRWRFVWSVIACEVVEQRAGATEPVSLETAQRAELIVRKFILPHAAVFYGDDRPLSDTRQIAAAILRLPGPQISLRELTISMFAPGAERDAFKITVGVKPNGLAFDSSRGTLIATNVGDSTIPDSYSVSVVDIARRERIVEVKVPGRTRWAIYDPPHQTFFVNIASPARIIAIDARDPTRSSKEYHVPAAGPHGLDLDPIRGRLLCACDAGVLFAIDAASCRVLGEVPLSGAPDVIFLHPQSGRLLAIGDPAVIDIIDVGTMHCVEVVPTEAGAHTLALDRNRNKVYSFLPQSHRAAAFIDNI